MSSLILGRLEYLKQKMGFMLSVSRILYVTYDVKYGQIPSSFRYRETVVTVRTQKYGLIPQEA